MYNILNDKNIIFHGIGFNIFGLIGILKYGILSNNKSKEVSNPYFCVNTVGSNGYDNICATLSPSINGISNSDAFNRYILNGLSFVIRVDHNINFSLKSSKINNYNDICYVKNVIPSDNIVGIMVNSSFLNSNISELPLGINKPNMTYSIVVPKKCNHLLKCIEMECGYVADRGDLDYYLAQRDYNMVENIMKKHISSAFCYKFNKKSITIFDVLNSYCPNLSLYDVNGNVMLQQSVSKK